MDERREEQPNEAASEGWHAAVRLEELPLDGTGLTVRIGDRPLAIFRHEDRVHALADTCPHAGASLGCGVLSRGEVTCPWHGWHFDLESGASGDGLDERVRVFPTRLGPEGMVQVRMPSGEISAERAAQT